MIELQFTKQLKNNFLDVSFSSSSNRVAILGASGAGKSMLLKCIAGIEQPDSGYLRIGERVLFDSQKKINVKPQVRHIGYLFPNYALFPTMTVAQNIAIGLNKQSRSKQKNIQELLNTFELTEYQNIYPDNLSSGQKQRVALARILIQEPDVILLDEPFSALDGRLKTIMMREMLRFLKHFRGIVFLVTHEKDEAYALSEELFIMDAGEIIEHATTKELFRAPQTKKGALTVGYENVLDDKAFSAKALHSQQKDVTDIMLEISNFFYLEELDCIRVYLTPKDKKWGKELCMQLSKTDFLQWQASYTKNVFVSSKDILFLQ